MEEKQLVEEKYMVIGSHNELVRIFDDGSATSEYFDQETKMKVITHYAAETNFTVERTITNVLRETLKQKLA